MLVLQKKLKNKRIQVGVNNNNVYIQFRKLIEKSEIESYHKNPPCIFNTNKNIAITGLCISKEAAIVLTSMLIELHELNFKIG